MLYWLNTELACLLPYSEDTKDPKIIDLLPVYQLCVTFTGINARKIISHFEETLLAEQK
jgi:hypothetical protein